MTARKKILSFLGIGILSSLLIIGCDSLNDVQLEKPSQAVPTTKLTLSAAASLKDAMEEIEPLYQQKHPETEITYNFGSSGSLQRQIEQGAPVDVFISAAAKQMDALDKNNLLLTETRQNLLKNQMVLIAPKNADKAKNKLDDFNDLTTKEIKAIALGEPESVPAGKYAQEILTSFDITNKVNAKAVYGKDVRQVLNYVATGNVDAGIVYSTDVRIGDRVEIVATASEKSHSPIIYPVAVIKDSDNPEAATKLVEFLTTPKAQAVFAEYGFVTMNNNEQ